MEKETRKKVGLLRYRTRASWETSFWADVMTFAEQRQYGILVCIDFEAFCNENNYNAKQVSFTEITE